MHNTDFNINIKLRIQVHLLTVPKRKVHNPLYLTNHWEYKHKQYIIEKPYKIATINEKKILIFQNCYIFRAFFEKAVFLENGRGKH